MMILEHEAKALLRSVGVAVPDGALIKPGSLTKPGTPRVKAYPVAVKSAGAQWRPRQTGWRDPRQQCA